MASQGLHAARNVLLLGSFVLGSTVAGCSCGGSVMGHPVRDSGISDGAFDAPSAPGIAGLVSIALSPADATIRATPSMPASQAYVAMGTFMDHHVEDVTTRVAFYILGADVASGLGSVSGATFHSGTTRGGHTTIFARAGDITGMTGLTVVMGAEVLVPPTMGGAALPPMPGGLFGGPTTGTAPELVYPNDGVVLPPNLGRIEIHWLQGSPSNTLFDVGFTNGVTDVHAYTRCERPSGVRADGCIWEISGTAWDYVARSNAGGMPVTVTVRGTSDTGGAVGVSAPRQLRFALDDLNGAIYYWTTSGGTAIMRYDFGGAATATGMPVMGPMQTMDGQCVGCHALSHDGTKIVGSVGGQNNGGMVLVDLVSSTVIANRSTASDHVLQFASFAPDANQMVAIYGDDTGAASFHQLMLFDTSCTPATMATCGRQVSQIDLGSAEASHPSWSPDGQHIAYTDVGYHRTSQRPGHGSIRMVDAMGAGWGAPYDVVPRADGLNRYNPDFAPLPMSSFLIYNESTCPGGDVSNDDCDADSDPSSKVWAVPLTGGAPTMLANAMAPGTMDMGTTDLQATFPRFAPFVFTLSTGDVGSTSVMYFTFASRRAYGLRSPSAVGSRATWLWMAALVPEHLAGGDPSFAAFALPFQALDTSNHIAVWTTESVGTGMLH